MTFVHVTEDHLRQLAEDRLPAGERQSVVRHLLTACPSCLELARKVLFPEWEQKPDYAGVLRRLELSAVLAWNDVAVETGVARALWDHNLARLAPGPRLMAIRNNPDLHTRGTFDLLLSEAKRIAHDQPLESLDLAYAALAVTDLLSPAGYQEECIHDLRASAWALLGNLKRLAGDFAGSQEALRAAAEAMEKGTGDPYETANVLSMTASLVTDLGQLEDAADLLEEAAVLARAVRDRPLEGRLRIQQASSISWVDPARGFELAERGLRLLRRSKSEDRHTELGGIHILAFCANELGETEEARATLETYRYLYASFPDPGTQGRLLLLDGLICRKEGRLEDSEALLRQLAAHYAENDLPFDLTLSTLEWAESLVLLDRFDEAAEVMRQIHPLIERWRVPVDVLRAWKIVQESVRARTVQETALRELSLTVRRKWFRGDARVPSKSS
jgi:tetratricopeptide (TPR) repeat protein